MKSFLLKDQKQFMNQLLKSGLFDHFLLSEASIHGAVSYHVDGHANRDFFDAEEWEELAADGAEYIPFSYFRPVCYELIRGKHTPVSFKLVFLLSPANAERTIASADCGLSARDVSGMFLNLSFREGAMTFTSGISYRTFTTDHALDAAWDALTARFLSKNNISFDVR